VTPERATIVVGISVKELANRFIAAQQANWRAPETTLRCYQNWLGRFLKDHPRLLAAELTVETFAAWKLSLRQRGYSPKAINHYLSAVRAMYAFADEAGLLPTVPRLKRVKNESSPDCPSEKRPLYTAEQLKALLSQADSQLEVMVLLALNCGFGPKDIHDLKWDDVSDGRVVLPRSKTGVSQTYRLWDETRAALDALRAERHKLIERLARRGRERSDRGRVFVTKYWRFWNRDAVAEQFRKLCRRAGVPCFGFYRLRHCASTALSLVAMPHVHRKFMRHKQLQQQVTYTHAPDGEVDNAIMKARSKLLGD
jgi:integrase